MKYYLFEGEINVVNISPVVNFINDTPGDITIYLNSIGGGTSTGEAFLNILNANKDRITLIAMAGVYSTAFDIFYQFEGKKSMTFGCKGMYHLSSNKISLMVNGKPYYDEDVCSLRNQKIDLKRDLELAEKFMTKAEIKKMKQNIDIYFDYERMKQIFGL